MHVLVVEDDPEINQLLCAYAQIAGFDTDSALSGLDALAIAAARAPDLVLLDLMLPDVDGLEVYRRLRTVPGAAGVPVIILTARTAESTRDEARQLGVADYLNKPFDPDRLIDAMRRHAGENLSHE